MEVRRKWGEVMRDYYGRVKRGDPQLAARTPDDQIRLVSYVFANTKQLDKVRLTGRRILWCHGGACTGCPISVFPDMQI